MSSGISQQMKTTFCKSHTFFLVHPVDAFATPTKAKQAHYVYIYKKKLSTPIEQDKTEMSIQEIIGTSRLSVKIEYKMADQWTEAFMVISSSLIV